MKIEIISNVAWINTSESLDEDIIEDLCKVCSYIPPTASYMVKEILRRRVDAGEENPTFDIEKLRTVLFNPVNYSFPAGLSDLIAEILLINGEDIDIKYSFPLSVTQQHYEHLRDSVFLGHNLWEHQQKALSIAVEEPRGIFNLPTGSGKTTLGLLLWLLWGRKRTVMLAPTTIICDQWASDFQEAFPKWKLGKFYGKHKGKIGGFNIMTNAKASATFNIQKDERALTVLNMTNFLLVDECHRVGAKSNGKPNDLYQTIINFPKIENVFGLTATAEMRSDEANIYQKAAIGDILLRIEPEHLVAKKILVPPRIKFEICPPVILRSKKKNERPTDYYRYQYQKVILRNEHRNLKAVKGAIRMAQSGRQVIIFVKFVEHINYLMSIFNKLDIDPLETQLVINYTHGEDEFKEDKLELFGNGTLRILVATDKLLGLGLNIPAISGLAYLVGEKSKTALAQAIGRPMRSYGNKFDCLILDFADATEPFSRYVINRLTYYHAHKYEIDLSNCKWLKRFI